MKYGFLYKLGSLSCVAFSLLLLCIFVSASEITQEEIDSYLQTDIDTSVIEDETVILDPEETLEPSSTSPVIYTEENPLYVQVTSETDVDTSSVDEPVSVLSDDSVSLLADAPIDASDTSGLKAVLLEILGPYEPILFTYSYGNTSVGREVFQDDVWLCSFWMLAIMVYSIFRLLGGWLSRKQ